MKQLTKIINILLNWIVGIILLGIVAILFVGVIFRYVLNAPLFWAEEVTVLGMIWFTFLAAAILVRKEKNVCITTITDFLKPKTALIVYVISDFLVLIILFVMLWQSYILNQHLALSMTPALQFNENWYSTAMIFGFAVMIFYHIQNMHQRLKKLFFSRQKG